jgi:hypothetical protein
VTEREIVERARKRVKEKKGFYAHLTSYLIVMAFLTILNLLTAPATWWVVWPALGWGIGLAFHYFGVFGILNMGNQDWEEKEMAKEISKLKKGSQAHYINDDHLDLEQEKLELKEIKKERIDWDDRDLV